jgi:hypothetical protein
MINSSLGDIVTPDNWNFIIECKSYASINFNGIITGYCDKLSGWIVEVSFDSDNEPNHMVVFKIVRNGTYIAIPMIEGISDKLTGYKVPHTLYPYYYDTDEQEDNLRWYVVLDYDILMGAYEAEPMMQQIMKRHVLHLAGVLDASN